MPKLIDMEDVIFKTKTLPVAATTGVCKLQSRPGQVKGPARQSAEDEDPHSTAEPLSEIVGRIIQRLEKERAASEVEAPSRAQEAGHHEENGVDPGEGVFET